MGEVYRKYIAALPLFRKHEIVDKLLQNVSLRTNRQDLLAIVNDMHDVEVETIAQIVFEGRTIHARDLKEVLPNGIISFRLTHPAYIEPNYVQAAAENAGA